MRNFYLQFYLQYKHTAYDHQVTFYSNELVSSIAFQLLIIVSHFVGVTESCLSLILYLFYHLLFFLSIFITRFFLLVIFYISFLHILFVQKELDFYYTRTKRIHIFVRTILYNEAQKLITFVRFSLVYNIKPKTFISQ